VLSHGDLLAKSFPLEEVITLAPTLALALALALSLSLSLTLTLTLILTRSSRR
jgi:hypothetical protein